MVISSGKPKSSLPTDDPAPASHPSCHTNMLNCVYSLYIYIYLVSACVPFDSVNYCRK